MAFTAALDAFVHVANLFATVSTGVADRCTGFAVVVVVITVAAHEVDAGRTSADAVEHQLDVILADVVAAFV